MLKIFCDVCSKECDNKDFMFEAQLIQVNTILEGNDLTPKKQPSKVVFNFCKDCYEKNIKPLFKNDEKK